MSILQEAERLAAVTQEVSGAYAIELARVLKDLERDLRDWTQAAAEGSATALQRAIKAAQARKVIADALERAGYSDLVAMYSDVALDSVVIQVERLRVAAGAGQFIDVDDSRILALKRLAKLDLFNQGDELAHAVWRTLAQGIFTNRPLNELFEDLADVLDISEAKARTLYDTAVNVFSRQLEAMKATGDEAEPFAYVGPRDLKTREFCDDLVGKVLTRADIEALDNGQLPNVFLTGGGYNCRHVWQAVSKYGPAAKLVGTDERLPEYEQEEATA